MLTREHHQRSLKPSTVTRQTLSARTGGRERQVGGRCICMHASEVHACLRGWTHVHVGTNKRVHMEIRMHTQAHMQAHSHAGMHSQACTRRHAHAGMHMEAHLSSNTQSAAASFASSPPRSAPLCSAPPSNLKGPEYLKAQST